MKNFNIYIHGRPQGQDIWPPCENPVDKQYIDPFLDSTIGNDIGELLMIDIYQGNAYYTYIQRKNYVEKIVRGAPGSSYFAITINVHNAICKNVSMLYTLFHRTYEQLCLGRIVQDDNGIKQYTISRFKDNVDDIITVIETNITQKIASSFVSFNLVQDTIDSVPVKYSLHDTDSPAFVGDMTKNRVLVSTEYLSKDEERNSLTKIITPLKNKKDELERDLIQKEQDLKDLKKENNEQQKSINLLEKNISDLEKKLASVANDFKTEYEKELKKKDKELQEIQGLYKKTTNELSKLQQKITESEENKDVVLFATQIKEPLDTYARQWASRFSARKRVDHTKNNSKRIIFKELLPWLNSFLLLCILAISIYTYFSLSDKKPDKVTGQVNPREEMARVQYNREKVDSTSTLDSLESLESTETTYIIDIKGFSGNGSLTVGKTYELKAKNCTQHVTWEVDGNGEIKNNGILKITGVGQVTIKGTVEKGIIKTRTISTN